MGQPAGDGEELIIGQPRGRVQRGRHHFHLAVGIEVHERDLVSRFAGRRAGKSFSHLAHRLAGLGQVRRPDTSPLGEVHAAEERRNHLAKLDEHHVGLVTNLGEWMGSHAQQ